MTIGFGSLFAGIGGLDLGLERAGMACKWQVEIDSGCLEVLEKHWPTVRRYSDVRACGAHNLEPVDLVCGGFPCQDVSVAGRRKGLAGSRSGLWFEFYRILAELVPRWVVIENVPGLLSSNQGRDFALIFRGLAELRYLSAWRILDAQYFGVAQRRRRVFIVGHLGDGRAAEVLFEPTCGSRDTPPSRETRARVTSHAPSGFGEYRQGLTTLRVGGGTDSQGLVAWDNAQGDPNADADGTAFSVNPQMNQGVAYGVQAFEPGNLRRPCGSSPSTEVVSTLGAEKLGDTFPHIAYNIQQNDGGEHRRKDRPEGGMYVKETDTALTVGTTDKTVVASPLSYVAAYGVRRLTPIECERLQGFPDNWTVGQSDTKRYKQLGNAVCVPVAEWLGRRILLGEQKEMAV